MNLKLSVRYKVWGFPYRSEQKATSVNYGYFDCKKDPTKIPGIAEVKDWPEMEEFIREICSPQSFFRTLGCDVGYSDKEADDLIHLKAYVDIAFEILNINFNKFNYYLLFDRLISTFRREKISDTVSGDFCIQYTVFHDHKFNGDSDRRKTGWTLVFRLHSVGRTSEEARLNWAQAVTVLRFSLMEISRENAAELSKGHEMIS